MIEPHGGRLVNCYVDEIEKEKLTGKADLLPKITVDDKNVSDLEMIASGAMSPLEGFMNKADYESVVDDMHLSNGVAWSIPITLAVDKETASKIEEHSAVALVIDKDHLLAVLDVDEIYQYDKKKEAEKVFRTTDEKHPGVKYVYDQGDYLVGGKIKMLNKPQHDEFLEYRLEPKDTRAKFAENGWKTVVAFQTRNPIHRAHEYLQKSALEIVDGLLIHPLVGRTKSDDIPADVRMKSYEVLLEKYYVRERVMLSVFPAAMRYAGPREAIFHAIVRKNYGCTHFIVGRDHAGVGDYYGTYDAQEIFEEFRPEEIGITPLKYEHAFYCKLTEQMATAKTSPSTPDQRVFLSGTKVREMLTKGEMPPKEFSRPEVVKVLMEGMQK